MSSAGLPTVRLNEPPVGWEYKVALVNVSGLFGPNVNVDQLGEYLNESGDDGWELVSMVDINRSGGTTTDLLLTLKRPRRG